LPEIPKRKGGSVENSAHFLYKKLGGFRVTMKNFLMKSLTAAAVAACLSCAGASKGKMTFYHGNNIPAQFIDIVRWGPLEIEFSIRVDFLQPHLYHIVLDENDPVAEGWFQTSRTKGQPYIVILKPKKGLSFSPGKEYRLCIGNENPEETVVYRSSYRCLADYKFVLPEKE
jgi:hypothetical protein